MEGLFKTLDETNSGMVQLVKFKRRMLEIKDTSSTAEATIARQQEVVRIHMERSKLADEALAAEEKAWHEEVTILPIDDELSHDVRLWRLLQANEMNHASKLVQLWDHNGDGVISKGEFRSGLAVGLGRGVRAVARARVKMMGARSASPGVAW